MMIVSSSPQPILDNFENMICNYDSGQNEHIYTEIIILPILKNINDNKKLLLIRFDNYFLHSHLTILYFYENKKLFQNLQFTLPCLAIFQETSICY